MYFILNIAVLTALTIIVQSATLVTSIPQNRTSLSHLTERDVSYSKEALSDGATDEEEPNDEDNEDTEDTEDTVDPEEFLLQNRDDDANILPAESASSKTGVTTGSSTIVDNGSAINQTGATTGSSTTVNNASPGDGAASVSNKTSIMSTDDTSKQTASVDKNVSSSGSTRNPKDPGISSTAMTTQKKSKKNAPVEPDTNTDSTLTSSTETSISSINDDKADSAFPTSQHGNESTRPSKIDEQDSEKEREITTSIQGKGDAPTSTSSESETTSKPGNSDLNIGVHSDGSADNDEGSSHSGEGSGPNIEEPTETTSTTTQRSGGKGEGHLRGNKKPKKRVVGAKYVRQAYDGNVDVPIINCYDAFNYRKKSGVQVFGKMLEHYNNNFFLWWVPYFKAPIKYAVASFEYSRCLMGHLAWKMFYIFLKYGNLFPYTDIGSFYSTIPEDQQQLMESALDGIEVLRNFKDSK